MRFYVALPLMIMAFLAPSIALADFCVVDNFGNVISKVGNLQLPKVTLSWSVVVEKYTA